MVLGSSFIQENAKLFFESKQCALHISLSGGRHCVLGKDTSYEFSRPIGDGRLARGLRVYEFSVPVKSHLIGHVPWCRRNCSHVGEQITPYMACLCPQCCCPFKVFLSGNNGCEALRKLTRSNSNEMFIDRCIHTHTYYSVCPFNSPICIKCLFQGQKTGYQQTRHLNVENTLVPYFVPL